MRICLFLLLLIPVLAKAQSAQHYPTIRIHVPGQDMELAIRNGAAPDHGVRWIGDSLELPAFDVDLTVLEQSPLGYRLIEAAPYRGDLSARSDDNCELPLRFAIESPSNFQLGELENGYYSMDDTWSAFREMKRLYPNLISERMVIDTFRTFEGREINYFRLSDNADTEENEPRVLLTALHHAREPLSLIQQIYFAWWLLENYGVDEEATWLVDHTELYLVPIVNPDGYAFNGAESGPSIGFWRKNRRDNGDGTFGIDLNRNYAYGFGGPGSSSDTESDIYRGTEALSEPETRAIDYLHRTLAFSTIVNAHTNGDLIIQPQLNEFQDENRAKTHQQLLWAMRRDNRYGVGDSQQTVGYVASGNSDDHFALFQSPGKTLAITCTPEIGQRRFSFYPPEEYVEPFAQDAILMNWRALQSAHFTPVVELKNDFLEAAGELNITVVNASQQDGTTTISIQSSDPAIVFSQSIYTITVRAGASVELSIPYTIPGSIPTEIVDFSIHFPDLDYIKPLVIESVPVYNSEILFSENMDMVSSIFGFPIVSTGDPLHPNAVKAAEDFEFTRFNIPVNLYEGIKALRVSYAHRFAFGSGARNVTLDVGNSIGGFQNVCTRQTSTNNPNSEPAYWGASPGFVYDSYVIPDVSEQGNFVIRWNLQEFGSTYNYELDDILVEALVEAEPVSGTRNQLSSTIQIYPNPTSDQLFISGVPSGSRIQIYNGIGQQVLTTNLQNASLDLSDFMPGQYLLKAVVKDKMETVRVVVQ